MTPEERAREIATAVLRAAGSDIRHYMPYARDAILEAALTGITAAVAEERERCARLADAAAKEAQNCDLYEIADVVMGIAAGIRNLGARAAIRAEPEERKDG